MVSLPSVFVVDDDEISRQSIAAVAETLQVQVFCFRDGEAFLANCKPEHAGCIVLDVRMPGRNGLEVFDELLARRVLLPVVMVTAYGDIPLAVAAVQKGVFAFLEKPCRGHHLWDTLKDALAHHERILSETSQFNDFQARLDLLSDDERRVMEMMLADIPSKTMAKRLGVSVRTVQFRRSAVYQRLRVDSLASLAAMCAASRVAPPQWLVHRPASTVRTPPLATAPAN
ncbi:MAG TPA: response regulator [Pirellulales bacterium]|nr:response regulator [Pirellulales bacterium]